MGDNKLALPAGTVLQSNYKLLGVLGQGGFGITYLAHDEALNQKVAIKEYLPNSLATRDAKTLGVQLHKAESAQAFQWGLRRFLEEARILARLSHPNIVRVMHFLPLHNTGYMIMQYEQGQVLKKWAQRFPGSKPPQEVLFRVLGPLLDALREVHGAGLAHRDIKPDNIYMRADDSPVLLDFGAARNVESGLSHTLAAIVTAGYSPNEQYGNVADQGPWTDIYAMGAVLYRLITGKTPTDAPSRITATHSGSHDPCERLTDLNLPSYDREFLTAIDWALEIWPKNRPQTVDEWLTAFGDEAREATRVVTRAIPTAITEPDITAVPTEEVNLNTAAETVEIGIHALRREEEETRLAEQGLHAGDETVAVNGQTAYETVQLSQGAGHSGQEQTQHVHVRDIRAEKAGKRQTFTNPFRKLSGIQVATLAASVVMLGTAGGIGWWLVQPVDDLIGDSFANAKVVGGLAKDTVEVSDYIGADDTDVIQFSVSEDSELYLNAGGAAQDAKLRIYDEHQKEVSIYRTAQGNVSELSRGLYYLQLTSGNSYASGYSVAMRTLPADLARRPQNKLTRALDLRKLGKIETQPVRYQGKLFPGQREHYFSVRLKKPAEISVTTNIVGGKGRVSLADDGGLVLESGRLRVEQAQNVRKVVGKGLYHVIVSSNDPKIFEYGLSVSLDPSKTDIDMPGNIANRPFIPIRKNKGKVFNVSASASVSEGTDKNETLLAAQSLARLKLVALALGEKGGHASNALRLSNVVKKFSHFNSGVPYNEKWNVKWDGNKVTVTLSAEFEKTKNNEYLKAVLSNSSVKALEPIRFDLSAKKDMYMGVFTWQADGTVLRLYPRKTGRYLIMTEGRKLSLPYQEEPPIRTQPMPGRSSSDEAIFAVGCYERADYTSVAGSIWDEKPVSISSQAFFQRLATSCKQGLAIRVMHYSVYKG